ncbi:hypothetical protein ACFQX6_02070 [Streptosporangium lutulentum]
MRDQLGAVLVELAQDARGVGGAVQDLLDLGLQQRRLLLHDEDLRQPPGERPDDLRLQRPEHADLEEADAQLLGRDPELAESFAHVVVGGAGGDDAEPGVAGVRGDLVELVLVGVRAGQLQARADERALHLQRPRGEQGGVGRVPVRPALVFDDGHDRDDPVMPDVHGAGGVYDVGDGLHRDPQAAGPGRRYRVAAQVEQLLDAAGVDDRHAESGERALGGRREGGGLAGRVVAAQGDQAALGVGADEVAVPERVGRAVHSGSLAVPDAQDAALRGLGRPGTSWLPHTAVAPSSSFWPGRCTTSSGSAYLRERASSWSKPPRGSRGSRTPSRRCRDRRPGRRASGRGSL